VAVPSRVDDTRVVFADIVCADPEWVRTEFDRMVAGIRALSTMTAAMPPRAKAPAGPRQFVTPPAGILRADELPERVRAPPCDVAARGLHR